MRPVVLMRQLASIHPWALRQAHENLRGEAVTLTYKPRGGHAPDCQMLRTPPPGFPFSCCSCNCAAEDLAVPPGLPDEVEYQVVVIHRAGG